MSVAPASSIALPAAVDTETSAIPPRHGPAQRVSLIVNRKSFRASTQDLASRAIALADRFGADTIEASDPQELQAALRGIVAQGSGRVIVLAGDGTVQALVDQIARLPVSEPRPQLMLLGGGRTNLIAAEFGGRGDILRKLGRALVRNTVGEIQQRHSLIVEQEGAAARHGFFMAGALVDSGIRACAQHRDQGNGALRTGVFGNAWCLLKLAVSSAIGLRALPLLPRLRVDAGTLGSLDGRMRVFIASTLQHPKGLLNPYADQGAGALRVTVVSDTVPGPRFWWTFVGMLMGRFGARMGLAQGYLSGRCGEVRLSGLTRYSLDGEPFDCDPQVPVCIRLGPPLQFVVAQGEAHSKASGD